MRKIIFLIVFVFNSVIGFAQYNTLPVNITGISQLKGDIYVYLYTSEKGFPIEISKANKFKGQSYKKELVGFF